MKTALLIFVILLAASQEGAGHFSKEGLAFDYPAGWKLEETGDAKMQRLMLTRASNIILVFAQREPVTNAAQLSEWHSNVTMPYVTNIAHKLGLNRPPLPDYAQCVNIGGSPAVGFRMGGILDGEPTTAEVYTVLLRQRFLHLVHVRADKDEAAGAAAWKTLLDTLKVEAPAQPSPETDKLTQVVMGGGLSGKAIKRPRPMYPRELRASRVSGQVTVKIIVDEKGDVISAEAVSGPSTLYGASIEAAKKAKFEPTVVCGRPVKVSGTMMYGFSIH